MISETDVRRLLELLRGYVDVDRCAKCEKTIGVTPTVFVLFPDEALVLYAAGTLLDGDPDAVAFIDWRPHLGRPDAVPHLVRHPDLSSLRANVRQRLNLHPPMLRPLLEAAVRGHDRAYLAVHWRQFRPAVLVALALAVQDGNGLLQPAPVDPDVARRATAARHDLAPLTTPDTAAPEMQHLALHILQLRVWQALCAEWTARTLDENGISSATATTSFQEDLDTYVVGEALMTGVDGPLALLFDDDLAVGSSPYIWRALQAAVTRSVARPNPAAEQWAEYYFAHEVACRLRPAGTRAELESALVSTDFARATVKYQAAWEAVSAQFGLLHSGGPDGQLGARSLREAYDVVHPVAQKAGHPQLAAAVLDSVVGSALDSNASAEDIVAAVLPDDKAGPVGMALALAGRHLDNQLLTRRGKSTDEVARRLLEAFGTGSRADLIGWWANRLNRDRRFTDTERLLDEYPVADDPDLAVAVRARLWGVRAAAHVGGGRSDEAVQLWRRIVTLVECHADELDDADRGLRPWARVNLGIALSEAGSPDEGLTLLEDVAFGADGYGVDAELLALMARTQVRFGRPEEGVQLLADAERLAGASPAAHRYAQQRAQQLTVLGRDAEAIQLLVGATDERPLDDVALLAEAASWANLLTRGAALPASATTRAEQMPSLLVERAERAASIGDITNHLALLRRHAKFTELLGADAGPLWEQLVARRRHHGVDDDPEELISAARTRHDAADLPGMRQLLAVVPAAVAALYGAVPDIELLVREPRALLRPLAELAGRIVADQDPAPSDIRLVAELQRDTVGRARTAHLDRRSAMEKPDDWFGDVGPRIPQDAGPVAVVEWIRTGEQSMRCLLTRIEDGRSESAYLPLAPVDPVMLARRLKFRLKDRTAQTAGSPLDEPRWRDLADSIVSGLSTWARDGDHVVFLHNEVYANLPWHTAVGPRWTVSYAASWTHLLRLLRSKPVSPRRLGICAVSRTGDADGIIEGLRAGGHRAVLAGADAGMDIHRPPPELCDHSELAHLLSTVDVALLLCHGHQPPCGDEIGWIVAHAGELLPADAVAAARAVPHHLFSWRDCLRLSRAPQTVLSAACASASAYGAGLGDRLGLFNALRHGGTTAMVAPGWDILAHDVLPVLDDVTARYLGGEPLGQALRAGCLAATDAAPDWLAWSLALEGDWR